MTLEILLKKINEHLDSLEKEDSYLDQLAEVIILKYLQTELNNHPQFQQTNVYIKNIANVLDKYNVDDVLISYLKPLLLTAIFKNNTELLEALISLRPSMVNTLFPRPDMQIKRNDTPLILAVIHKPIRVDLVQMLVKAKGIDSGLRCF